MFQFFSFYIFDFVPGKNRPSQIVYGKNVWHWNEFTHSYIKHRESNQGVPTLAELEEMQGWRHHDGHMDLVLMFNPRVWQEAVAHGEITEQGSLFMEDRKKHFDPISTKDFAANQEPPSSEPSPSLASPISHAATDGTEFVRDIDVWNVRVVLYQSLDLGCLIC